MAGRGGATTVMPPCYNYQWQKLHPAPAEATTSAREAATGESTLGRHNKFHRWFQLFVPTVPALTVTASRFPASARTSSSFPLCRFQHLLLPVPASALAAVAESHGRRLHHRCPPVEELQPAVAKLHPRGKSCKGIRRLRARAATWATFLLQPKNFLL